MHPLRVSPCISFPSLSLPPLFFLKLSSLLGSALSHALFHPCKMTFWKVYLFSNPTPMILLLHMRTPYRNHFIACYHICLPHYGPPGLIPMPLWRPFQSSGHSISSLPSTPSTALSLPFSHPPLKHPLHIFPLRHFSTLSSTCSPLILSILAAHC